MNPHVGPFVANPKLIMKARKSSNHINGDGAGTDLTAKAATAQKIAEVARKHFKMLKAECKQARKAFKQARKAAKRARKEAEEAAQELLIAKNDAARRHKPVKKIARRTQQPTQRKTQTATAIPLPSAATASVSTGTA
jgi:hypothetical protein